MKRLRIALLTYSTQPRGGVVHAMELAEALDKLGHEVCLFALDKGNGFFRAMSCRDSNRLAAHGPEESIAFIEGKQANFVS